MYASMHERLLAIAKNDSDREQQLGSRCPIRLDLFLTGGFVAENFSLSDGENSVDDASIDLQHRELALHEVGAIRIVAIEHIVMIAETWPTDADEAAAFAAKKVAV